MKGPVGISVSRPTIHVSQGSVVVGAIFAAWILWLAVNNKLIVYWQILTGQGGAASSTQAPNSVVTAPGGTPGTSATGTVTSVTPPTAYTGMGSP
jgi:hypothetical protein